MEIATIKTRLTDAFVWLGLLTLGLGGAFLFLLGRVDDRFEKADAKITTISSQVGDMRVELAAQGVDVKAILEKVDAPKLTASMGHSSTRR